MASAARISKSFERFREYQRRFGFFSGAALWMAMHRGQRLPAGQLFAARVPGFAFPVMLRAGTSDPYVFNQIILRGEGDLDVEGPPPKLIVDAGANIGLTAIMLANRYPQAKVIAIECEPGNFELLKKNTRPYSNITCVQKALWHLPGHVRIVDSQAQEWAFQVTQASPDDPDAMETITVEEILRQSDADRIDLLKIDIEGAEIEVLGAGRSWLPKVRVLAVELHDRMRAGCSDALEGLLRGYRCHRTQHGEYEVVYSAAS